MYHFALAPAMPCLARKPAGVRRRRPARRGTVGDLPGSAGDARGNVGKSVKPAYWDEATRALGERDRVLKQLIRAYPGIHLRRRSDPFTTLARAIVGQQISVKAADSIWRRFVATVAPDARSTVFPRLDPAARRGHRHRPAAQLRAVGAQGRVPARPRGALRLGGARSEALAEARRRGADPRAGRGQGHRPLDRRDVPDLPRAARRTCCPSTTSACSARSRCTTTTAAHARRRPCASSRARGSPTAASRRGICGARSIPFRSSTDRSAATRVRTADGPSMRSCPPRASLRRT